MVFLLYYVYCRKEIFVWVWSVVFGVLGYFLVFIDFIFDLILFLGYIDDMGVLVFGLVIIVGYINEDVKVKVCIKFYLWFGVKGEVEI